MAIRLNRERMLGLLIFVLFLVWALLTATGCAADNTGVDLSGKTTTTATTPVATGDVTGNVTAITVAGATPWTLALALGLLLAFQARRQNTATGALDRVVSAIEDRYSVMKDLASPENHEARHHAAALKDLRNNIETRGRIAAGPGYGRKVCDRHERLIRRRLARMKK